MRHVQRGLNLSFLNSIILKYNPLIKDHEAGNDKKDNKKFVLIE